LWLFNKPKTRRCCLGNDRSAVYCHECCLLSKAATPEAALLRKRKTPCAIRNMPILDELVVPATIAKRVLYLAVPRYVEPGWTVLSAGTQESISLEDDKFAEQP